ncbi:MAG TPA: DUF5677 domain-containing protein [Bryobacteraceae bacterium]
MCKQSRSIRILAAAGLVEDAESLLRTQYEASLAALFVLKRRLVLRRGRRRLSASNAGKMDSPFRARLYLAYAANMNQRMYGEFTKTKGLRRFFRKRFIDTIRETAAGYEKEIGPDWTKWQKDGKGFAGMPLIELAACLGEARVYATIYRKASSIIHATDALKYIDPTDSGTLLLSLPPSPHGVGSLLSLSCLCLGKVLHQFNERCSLGLDNELARWHDRIVTMRDRVEESD